MAGHREFLRYAEVCSRLARDAGDVDRDDMTAMARAWRDLAAEEERIADLARAVDRLFAARSGSAQPVRHRRRAFMPGSAGSPRVRSSQVH